VFKGEWGGNAGWDWLGGLEWGERFGKSFYHSEGCELKGCNQERVGITGVGSGFVKITGRKERRELVIEGVISRRRGVERGKPAL